MVLHPQSERKFLFLPAAGDIPPVNSSPWIWATASPSDTQGRGITSTVEADNEAAEGIALRKQGSRTLEKFPRHRLVYRLIMADEQGFLELYEGRVLPFYRSGSFGEFSGVGGMKIRTAAFERKDSSGALVILPGKSETYLKYAEFFYDLQELALSLYAMDHRGMGFSERPLPDRLKTHVESFDHYIEDVRNFVETVVKVGQHEHMYLFGHSTGALIAALYMERYPETFQAAVLCCPLFNLNVGPIPGFLLRALALLLDRPGRHEEYGLGQKNLRRPDFLNNKISHSYPRWSLWEQDIIPNTEALQLGGVTNHWLRESVMAGHRAVRGAERITVPLLMLQAGQDSIVRLGAQDRFCRRAPRCTKLEIAGAKHEILIERDDIRAEALTRIKGFLAGQLQNS
jgi:lysophospholipase